MWLSLSVACSERGRPDDRTTALAPVLLIAAGVALAGCTAAPDTAGPPSADTITVVASTTVYGDLAATIGGDAVEVTSIIDDPNKDPHEYEASAQNQLALAVTADGVIYAATQSGLFASQDNAATFALIADAPTLYLLDAAGDELVGVDTDGQLWRRSGQAAWTPIGTAEGTVAALGLAPSGVVYVVDDRGIVALDGDQATTILPAL